MPSYTQAVLSPDPLYLQPKSYDARADRKWFADVLDPGVVGTGDFLGSVVSGMTVRHAGGVVWVKGQNVADQGMYRQYVAGNTDLVVTAAHATLPRLDQAIIRIMDGSFDSSTVWEGRVEIVPGTATAGATLANRAGAADLTNLLEDSKNVLLLTDILVPAAASSLVAGNLGDKRTFARLPLSKLERGSENQVIKMSGGIPVWGTVDPGALTLISDQSLGSDTPNFDFTSIPGTYKHLMLIVYARGDNASAGGEAVGIRFNNDSSAIYYNQIFQHHGSTTTAGEALGVTRGEAGLMPKASDTANRFGEFQVTIPNYANTANHKSWDSKGVCPYGTGSTTIRTFHNSGVWAAIAAINRITLLPITSANFKTGSRVSLYGVN